MWEAWSRSSPAPPKWVHGCLNGYWLYINIILTGNSSFDISYFKKPVHRWTRCRVFCVEPNKNRRVFWTEQYTPNVQKYIGAYMYIYIYAHILMHFFMCQAYILFFSIIIYCVVHTWTMHRRFLTVFFFLFVSSYSRRREHNIYRPVRLKTFSGYLGVDLADTKGPQKVICHPLLTRFIRQQKSKKKKKK